MYRYFVFLLFGVLGLFPNAAYAQTQKSKPAKKPVQKQAQAPVTPVPEGFSKAPSGLVYKLISASDTARQAKPGDVILIHIELLTMGDTSFISTYYPAVHPIQLKLNRPQYSGCINEGLAMMRIGDSAVFIAYVDSLYNQTLKNPNIPPVINPSSFVKVRVKMLDTKSELELFMEKEALKKKYSDKEVFAIEEYLHRHQYNAIQSPSGLRYINHIKTEGLKPQAGDTLLVHYTGRLLNDSVFSSSIEHGEPISVILGQQSVIDGWEETLKGLRKGESCTVIIPFSLAYGEHGREPRIPPYATLVFDITLVDIKPKPHAIPFDITGKTIKTTSSGLQYVVVSRGNGDEAYYNHKVTVHYTGYLTDGTIFDSSVEKGQPYTFMLGARRVIQGWEEGIRLMHVGDKYRFIIPPQLGYGSQDMGLIPPNSMLIFDIELLQVD